VLDPACGSGNFLALSLRALKDFDLSVTDDAVAMGIPPDNFRIGPEAVMGIEVNSYAAELARLTVWITELQWQLQKGLLITQSGKDSAWPEADVVMGNPPFLGGKLMRKSLGDAYVDRLFVAFVGRVPAEADLVAYWFAKTWERMREGRLKRAGLVATNSMRGGATRRVLDRIVRDGKIFDAWDDERWVLRGVSVRVSLICFAKEFAEELQVDGQVVHQINSDLTGATVDITAAKSLEENQHTSFQGVTKGGAFGVDGVLARQWLEAPVNPNGRYNSDVLRPTVSGGNLAKRFIDKWVIDFGMLTEREAALYAAPFGFVTEFVRPERINNRRELYKRYWWRFAERRPGMWTKLNNLNRYIATPKVSRHRFFRYLGNSIIPDNLVIVITRDDDATFGILSSRIHRAWSLAKGAWCGVGNDPTYTPTSTFETYPFPEGLTPNVPAAEYGDDRRPVAISEAAWQLNELREAWLNPPDLVERVPEVAPGYPDRIVPINPKAAAILKTRTLTNLYNERPAWLDNAHRDLDAAVASAYGWPTDIAEEEALARLLALNLERAAAGR
jgi:type II restriction/modification system DNA methylase subunit YeeA